MLTEPYIIEGEDLELLVRNNMRATKAPPNFNSNIVAAYDNGKLKYVDLPHKLGTYDCELMFSIPKAKIFFISCTGNKKNKRISEKVTKFALLRSQITDSGVVRYEIINQYEGDDVSITIRYDRDRAIRKIAIFHKEFAEYFQSGIYRALIYLYAVWDSIFDLQQNLTGWKTDSKKFINRVTPTRRIIAAKRYALYETFTAYQALSNKNFTFVEYFARETEAGGMSILDLQKRGKTAVHSSMIELDPTDKRRGSIRKVADDYLLQAKRLYLRHVLGEEVVRQKVTVATVSLPKVFEINKENQAEYLLNDEDSSVSFEAIKGKDPASITKDFPRGRFSGAIRAGSLEAVVTAIHSDNVASVLDQDLSNKILAEIKTNRGGGGDYNSVGCS